jgi:hypothetical protein
MNNRAAASVYSIVISLGTRYIYKVLQERPTGEAKTDRGRHSGAAMKRSITALPRFQQRVQRRDGGSQVRTIDGCAAFRQPL